jgi:hypothetical protein
MTDQVGISAKARIIIKGEGHGRCLGNILFLVYDPDTGLCLSIRLGHPHRLFGKFLMLLDGRNRLDRTRQEVQSTALS